MNEITIQKISNKQREQIRWMYFGNYELTDISMKLDIDIDTVRFFVFGIDGTGKDKTCLFQIKKGLSSTAIGSFLKDKSQALEMVCGTALSILSKSLVDLQIEVVNGKVLELPELKMLSSIVVEMDKLVRLESGLATETIQHMGLSRAEARDILAADPFAPRDVEVESIQVLPWLADE